GAQDIHQSLTQNVSRIRPKQELPRSRCFEKEHPLDTCTKSIAKAQLTLPSLFPSYHLVLIPPRWLIPSATHLPKPISHLYPFRPVPSLLRSKTKYRGIRRTCKYYNCDLKSNMFENPKRRRQSPETAKGK